MITVDKASINVVKSLEDLNTLLTSIIQNKNCENQRTKLSNMQKMLHKVIFISWLSCKIFYVQLLQKTRSLCLNVFSKCMNYEDEINDTNLSILKNHTSPINTFTFCYSHKLAKKKKKKKKALLSINLSSKKRR